MPAPARHNTSTLALRQERFVSGLINGMAPADAYLHAGYKPKDRHGARVAGSRMLAKADVQARLAALREAARKNDVLTLQEKREFLKRVVLTPAGEVHAGDDVCEKASRTILQTKDGTVEKHVVVMPCKLKALELDAKLAGELLGGVEPPLPLTTEEFTISPESEARINKVLEAMLRLPHCGVELLRAQPSAPPPEQPANKMESIALLIAESMFGRNRQNAQQLHNSVFFTELKNLVTR